MSKEMELIILLTQNIEAQQHSIDLLIQITQLLTEKITKLEKKI